MTAQIVSTRYAKALFARAQLTQTLDDVAKAASALKDALTENIIAMLADPALAHSQKEDALLAGVKNGELQAFVRLLAQDGRADLLPQALAAFQVLVHAANNHVQAKVTSATALTETQRKALTQYAKKASGANTVELDEYIDPAVLAGVRLQVGSQLWDMTVQTKLRTLQQRLGQS